MKHLKLIYIFNTEKKLNSSCNKDYLAKTDLKFKQKMENVF